MTDPNDGCARVRALFSSAYDDEFAAGDRELFYTHLRACPACGREYADYRKALMALRALDPVPAGRDFEKRVIGAVSEDAGRSTLLAISTEPAATQPMAARRGRHLPLRRAAAAALLVGLAGFGAGLALRPAPPPAPEDPPAGMVRAGSRLVPADRFVEETLAARGFTRLGGRWLPAGESDAVARGETWYRGRWRTQWELREALLGDPADAPPAPPPAAVAAATPGAAATAPAAPAPAPAPPADETLRALGYVRLGDRWVSVQEKEWIDKGYVLYRDRWLSPAELQKEILVAENFVLHDGRWMTREERERLLASAPRSLRPATAEDALAVALRDLVIGDPVADGGLAVYPLYARTTLPDEPWVLLDAALRGGKVELRDEKQTRRLKARNADDRPVLLLAGDLLAGGHQDRAVARDLLLLPNRKWTDVEVYCAEPGRSAGKGDRIDAAPALAPPDLRGLLAADAGQPAFWAGVHRRLDAFGVKSPTGSLCALYASTAVTERTRAVERRLGDVPTRDVRTVGVALGSDLGLVAAECFPSNTLLRQAWPRMLAAAAAHGGSRRADGAAPAGAVPNTRAGVNQVLEQAIAGDWVRAAAGDGASRLQLRSAGAISGEACVAEGRVGHVAFHLDASASDGAPAYALDPGKAQRLAAELARAMAGPDPAERARAVREFGPVRWDRAAEILAGLAANETDDEVRIALAEALAATRSPAAVKPLTDLLDKAPRRGPVSRAAAMALARTGDPRAVDALVRLLHLGDAETARAGLDAFVLLVPRLRDPAALEKAVSRLVSFLEGLDAHTREHRPAAALCPTHAFFEAVYDPARAALSAVARVPFASGGEARTWWSRSRETFLRGAAAPVK
jgi:hypothetical protein